MFLPFLWLSLILFRCISLVQSICVSTQSVIATLLEPCSDSDREKPTIWPYGPGTSGLSIRLRPELDPADQFSWNGFFHSSNITIAYPNGTTTWGFVLNGSSPTSRGCGYSIGWPWGELEVYETIFPVEEPGLYEVLCSFLGLKVPRSDQQLIFR
jgi:hypothetical protein